MKAYESWNPKCNLEEIRQLLWAGDEYYRKLDVKISNLWSGMAPDASYERDLDWYQHKKREATKL